MVRKLTRLFVLGLPFVMASALVAQTAQQTPPQTPPAGGSGAQAQGTPTPAPAPRPTPPDAAAMTAALGIANPQDKLAALEKFKVDFPTSSILSVADTNILSILAAMPNKTGETATQLDKVLGRIAQQAPPEVRSNQIVSAVNPLVQNKVLLDRAEPLLKDALAMLDANGFDAYAERQRTSARTANRTEPTTAELQTQFNTTYRSRALDLLARLYVAKGDSAKAEETYREAFKAAPTNAAVTLALAKLELARGDNKNALDHFLASMIAGGVRSAGDRQALSDLYAKVNGSVDGFEAAIDKLYRETFPNPVTPEAYKPTEKRSDRMVLLEMFTGSGCPPCVSADLALDAVMERYHGAVVPIAYHQNIPAPDPMVIDGGIARKNYYTVGGVPTFNIDGALGRIGGGARAATPGTYATYIKMIDAALERPAQAALNVSAIGAGGTIKVSADVSKIDAANAKDLRLHLLIVERELRFIGENGIRFHPMVVRAIAGDKGAGIEITGNGKTEYTFNLAEMSKDTEATLAAEINKRRSTEPEGSIPREYSADGRAMTHIETSELMVVAFVQSGAYKKPASTSTWDPSTTNVLQAVMAPVAFSGPSKNGGR